jgi:hypothetical protein
VWGAGVEGLARTERSGRSPRATSAAAASASSSPAAPVSRRSLALPVEQRANLRRLLDTLHRRVRTSKTDLEEAVATVQSEAAVKEMLAGKVGELESQLDALRRSAEDAVAAAQGVQEEQQHALQWELQEARNTLLGVEAAVTAADERTAEAEARVAVAEATAAAATVEAMAAATEAAAAAVEAMAATAEAAAARDADAAQASRECQRVNTHPPHRLSLTAPFVFLFVAGAGGQEAVVQGGEESTEGAYFCLIVTRQGHA